MPRLAGQMRTTYSQLPGSYIDSRGRGDHEVDTLRSEEQNLAGGRANNGVRTMGQTLPTFIIFFSPWLPKMSSN